MEETKHGYISLNLHPSTADTIHSIMIRCGVLHPLPPREMHVTLMYDKSNPTIDPECDPKREFEARVEGFGILGDAIVVHLSSEDINKRHQELRNKGFKHSFDDYTCHMTLKYIPLIGPTGAEEEYMKLQQLYTGGYFDNIPLYFIGEKSSPIKDNDGMTTKLSKLR